jgi:hypothetical protein
MDAEVNWLRQLHNFYTVTPASSTKGKYIPHKTESNMSQGVDADQERKCVSPNTNKISSNKRLGKK